MREARWEARCSRGGLYLLTWRGRDGGRNTSEAAGIDISPSGVGVECACELKVGSIVHVQSRDGACDCECEVVHCTQRGARFHVGLEFRDEVRAEQEPQVEVPPAENQPDFYETLQISRKADIQTINRVYRIMAVRFHPDNPETGDLEQFLRMKQAYAVLSDPERRKEYDATLEKKEEAGPKSIFGLKDFVVGVEAEANRRLGVLAILYRQRQRTPDHPGVSLLNLEKEMGFPREYLTFTTWYLMAKAFIIVADNSDYTLTAAGADYLEKKALRNEIVGKLLNPDARHPRSVGRTGTVRHQRKQPPRRILLTAPNDAV